MPDSRTKIKHPGATVVLIINENDALLAIKPVINFRVQNKVSEKVP